jgi:hypothetical protein
MDKRLLQRVRGAHAIPPSTTSGTTPVVSSNIARLGANGAMARSAILVIEHGAMSVGTVVITPTITEGATTSPVTAVTMKSALPAFTPSAAGVEIYQLNLEGIDANFKVTLTPATGDSGVVTLTCAVILGDMDINPEATAAVVYEKSA